MNCSICKTKNHKLQHLIINYNNTYVAEPVAEQITENSVPKKRGRKPKNETANPVTVGPGRPTLARNALVDDIVQPVLRRSENL